MTIPEDNCVVERDILQHSPNGLQRGKKMPPRWSVGDL